MSILATKSLSLTLGVPLFAGLTFNVEPGDRMGLVAANGRGKSSLLRLLAGALEPTSGDVTRARAPYTTIAEKLEAMVVLGEATTRLKDYFDLFELPRVLSFDGPTLVEAIRRTFERRSRQVPAEPLEGLSDAFAASPIHSGQWRAFLGKNQVIGSDPDFGVVVASIRRFAQPAIDAVHDQRTLVKRWPPGGPWN